MTRNDPPAGLSERSLALWKAERRTRSRSSSRLAVLEQALRALDRADALRALLDTAELVTVSKSTGVPHLNPLWKAQQEALATFTRLARLLGLEWDAERDGAPDQPSSIYMRRSH